MKVLIPVAWVALYIEVLKLTDEEINNLITAATAPLLARIEALEAIQP